MAELQIDSGNNRVKQLFAQVSPKLLAALNALYVYGSTGQGKMALREHMTARTCIRLTVRDRDYLFTDGDCEKFDRMILMSEVSIFEAHAST